MCAMTKLGVSTLECVNKLNISAQVIKLLLFAQFGARFVFLTNHSLVTCLNPKVI